MKLEAGNDPARLAEMVTDADARRAVYLGNSTDEQNRLRQNYYNGTPNPVPLTDVANKMGIKTGPSAEGRAIAELTAAPGSMADMENRRGRIAAGLFNTPNSGGLSLEERDRVKRIAPNPLSPAAGPIPTPATSLGMGIPGGIAGSLLGIINQVTGNGLNGLPTGVRAPVLMNNGLAGPTKPTAPQSPQPTAPKPVAPTPAPPPPTPHPATAGLVAPTQTTVKTYPTTSPRDTHGPGHGALEY
jgi:hypothetical protein